MGRFEGAVMSHARPVLHTEHDPAPPVPRRRLIAGASLRWPSFNPSWMTVVNVALPDMAADLHLLGGRPLTWVVTTYHPALRRG
ncbi:hypothetical protein SALBM311S_11163 [Streptomyces alboniger]